MTAEEINSVVKQAAREAVREMLLGLGVNASDPDDMIKTQLDFAHLRAWRESTDAIKRRGLMAAVTVVVTGGLGWLATIIWYH